MALSIQPTGNNAGSGTTPASGVKAKFPAQNQGISWTLPNAFKAKNQQAAGSTPAFANQQQQTSVTSTPATQTQQPPIVINAAGAASGATGSQGTKTASTAPTPPTPPTPDATAQGAKMYQEYVTKEGNVFSQINPQYQQYIQQGASAANDPAVQEAYKAIAALNEQYNSAVAGVNQMGGLNITSASGLLGNLKNAYENNLTALQGQLQSALTKAGLSQTGYQQAAQAELAGANTAQAGYQAAATATAPQTVPYTSALFYPGGGPTAFGTVGGGKYGTGPAAAANTGSIVTLTTQLNNWNAAKSAAQTVFNQQLMPLLGVTNPSDINAINSAIQQIAGNVSNPQYKSLQNILADMAASYAQILTQPGQDPTNLQTSIAQSLINGAMSSQGIMNVINQLDATAQSKIQGTQSTINSLQTGGGTSSTTSGTTGGTSSQNQSQWSQANIWG